MKDLNQVTGKVSIKPYCDPTKENMGLENYGYVVYPGTMQIETLAAVESNGKLRYLTGLNEFAPEVKQITDPEKRAAIITDIRKTIIELEKERAYNTSLKIDDEDFWNKVELFKPDNQDIWGAVSVKLNNDEQFLDPAGNLDHVMLIKAIEAGGFTLVAPSFEDAKRLGKKWYLDRQINSNSVKTSVVKLRNKALSILNEISDENPRKLFYIAKDVSANSMGYNNRTFPDVIYDDLDKYINGLSYDNDKKRCAESFIKSSELSLEDLKIKAIIKDASFYKFITAKVDGILYEASQNVMLGRNVAEALEYLKNPLNQDILDILMAKVEGLWAQ